MTYTQESGFRFYVLVHGIAIREMKIYFQAILFGLSSVTLKIAESLQNIFIV